MRIALITVAVVLFGHTASSGQGEFMVYGQGNLSCGRWTQLNKDRRDTHLYTWVVGFVSGAGSTRIIAKTDSDAIAVSIDQYCAVHPLDNVAKAADVLVSELIKRR